MSGTYKARAAASPFDNALAVRTVQNTTRRLTHWARATAETYPAQGTTQVNCASLA